MSQPDYIEESFYESIAQSGQPSGKAPNAEYSQVGAFDGGKSYALVLRDGDELFSAIVDFAQKLNVQSAKYRAIGALRDVQVGWLNREKKQYLINKIDKQVECTSVIGSIGRTEKGDITAHTHMTVADETARTYGGHLVYAIASPTIELFIDTFDEVLLKTADKGSGISLYDLEDKI